MVLSVAVIASVVLRLGGWAATEGGGVALHFLWMFGLIAAWHVVFNAALGRVAESTLHVTPMEISGRAGWPSRRWRSVRLDALAEVGYFQHFGKYSIDHFFTVRDQAGGRVTVPLRTGMKGRARRSSATSAIC